MATLIHLKQFFNYATAKEFAEDSKKLTPEDKQEMLDLLQKEMDAGRWVPPNTATAAA